jgi:hypothetical protein
VHENPIMSMCWVDINVSVPFGLLYLLLHFLGIQLTTVIIPHFFLELTGSNLSWCCYFWIYFCLILFQEYVIQQLLAKCQTDGSFGK